MNSKILLSLICIFFITTNVFAQYQFGPKQTDYRRDLKKYQNNNVVSYGLSQLNTEHFIGRESGPYIHRAVYQWDIPDSQIPDNSQINFIRLTFTYSKLGHSFELPANFYKISYDMISEDYLDEIFAEMNYTVDEIGYQMGSNNHIIFESTGSGEPFNLAIKNMLPNDKFVLGIKWQNDHSSYNYKWGVSNYSINLYIEFTPPTQQVTVDQKLPDNTSIDSVGLYNFSQTRFDKFSVPQTFLWDVGSSKTLQGSQKIINYNKYQKWLNEPDVINHRTFNIEPSTNFLTSQFNQTHDLIKIRNTLEETTVNGGLVSFKDPWLIDYPDPLYGNSLRNRGMDAPFKQRNSPFFPDYTTNYNGDVYKGVFLNQPYTGNNPVYYSVKTDYEQNIFLNQTGRTHKFYFQGWSASPQGSAEFQNANLTETPVVFKQANATVQANLKGTQLSNNSSAYSKGSQRKFRC